MLPSLLIVIARGDGVCALSSRPDSVEPAIMIVIALVCVRTKEIALGLHQVRRQMFASELIEVA